MKLVVEYFKQHNTVVSPAQWHSVIFAAACLDYLPPEYGVDELEKVTSELTKLAHESPLMCWMSCGLIVRYLM